MNLQKKFLILATTDSEMKNELQSGQTSCKIVTFCQKNFYFSKFFL